MYSIAAAIHHMAETLDAQTGTHADYSSMPAEPTFLGISAELRNCIYAYTLFHTEGDGVIGPMLRTDTEHREVTDGDSIVLKVGRRFTYDADDQYPQVYPKIV